MLWWATGETGEAIIYATSVVVLLIATFCLLWLLAIQVFGKNIFTYKIPVVGISACDFASYLQIIVDAVDQIVNDCSECDDDEAPKSPFSVMESKLSTLLQDAVGGSPSVQFISNSNDVRTTLEIDLILAWSFQEIKSLQVDLDAIFDGLDLDPDIKDLAKGILAFEGTAQTNIKGGLSFILGLGLEYDKKSKTINSYIKGITGLELTFGVHAHTQFSASIGPFSAEVDVRTIIDNSGPPLSIRFGLEDSLNYIISSNKSLKREGFVVSTIGELVDAVDVAISGQVIAQVDATILGGIGKLFVDMRASDINSELCTSWYESQFCSQINSHKHMNCKISYKARQELYQPIIHPVFHPLRCQ